jgi:NADH:ubiquinone oxidoreductase subunit 6 (subunit J)
MTIAQIIFYAFAALTIGSALVIILTKNVLYAAFSLILTFLGVAAMYVFAGADFVGVSQIIVYVGGILILLIFGVMLTNRLSGQKVTTGTHNKFSGFLIGLTVFALLLYAIIKVNFSSLNWIQKATTPRELSQEGTINLIGIKLMSDFVLPFEVAGILLLLALIGAVFIAKRQLP